MSTCKFLLTSSIVAVVLGVSLSAQAEIVATTNSVSGEDNSVTVMGAYGASATDLVNSGQTTLSSAVRSHADLFDAGTTVSRANNGAVLTATTGGEGDYYPLTMFGEGVRLPVTYTFMLNTTSINAQGYDITQIDSFAGWNENNLTLANQKFTVEVSKVGSTDWLSVGTYTYKPFTDLETLGATESLVSLTNQGSGVLNNGSIALTGVDGIRITYMDNGSQGAIAVDGMVLQEIDVVGQATIPEPSTTVLSIAGAAALLAYAWRKRK